MKFYTGQGDKGASTLLGSSKRISKTDKRFEALGAVDELNSYLGVCRSLAKDQNMKNALLEAQENLFIIQAELGHLRTSDVQGTSDVQRLGNEKIQWLETTIDKFGDKIGVITKFSIPGGTTLSAHLDYARTVCRRAERAYLGRQRRRPPSSLGNPIAKYLNRLSSLLFVLARYANKKARICEKNPGYG